MDGNVAAALSVYIVLLIRSAVSSSEVDPRRFANALTPPSHLQNRLRQIFVGLDIHKKTVSYCVKDVSGQVLSEGKIAANQQAVIALRVQQMTSSVRLIEALVGGWNIDQLPSNVRSRRSATDSSTIVRTKLYMSQLFVM
jgi:hypothetical protein